MMVRSRRPITIPKAGTCSNNLHQGREEYIEGSVRILWSLTGPIGQSTHAYSRGRSMDYAKKCKDIIRKTLNGGYAKEKNKDSLLFSFGSH